jgi:PAS domain S-box-containing protein
LDNFTITPDHLKRGISMFEFIDPAQLEHARERFQRVLRLEEPGPEEYRLLRRDGTSFPAIVNSSVIYREGEIAGIRGVVVDITRRKAAQERMRRLSVALENLGDAVIFTDPEFKITFWNKCAEVQYGWTSDEAVGRDIHELLKIEYVGQERSSAVAELLANGFWRGEFLHRRKDGRVINVQSTRALVKDDGASGIVIVARDVTKDKALHAELTARETRFRSTLDAMLEGCLILDHDLRYIYVNEAMAKQARMTREEMIGKTVMELFPGSERTHAFQRVKDCLQKRVPHHMDNEYVFPDGSHRWFELRIEPVPEGVLILSLDITQHMHGEDRV